MNDGMASRRRCPSVASTNTLPYLTYAITNHEFNLNAEQQTCTSAFIYKRFTNTILLSPPAVIDIRFRDHDEICIYHEMDFYISVHIRAALLPF